MTRDDGLRSPMYAGSWPYTLYTGTNDYLIQKGTHDVHAFVDWLRLLVERLPSRGRYTQAGVLTHPLLLPSPAGLVPCAGLPKSDQRGIIFVLAHYII